MYPAQTTSSTPSLGEPVGHRVVALGARPRSRRARRRRSARGLVGALERARRRATFEATAITGSPASSSAWRFVPSPIPGRRSPFPRAGLRVRTHPQPPSCTKRHVPATDGRMHSSTVSPRRRLRRRLDRPITGTPACASGRDDRAVADPEVEDAALLLLGDALRRRASANTGGRSHAAGSIRAPSPSGRTRARLPAIPPPVMWASARTSRGRAEPADVVEVEPRRREQQIRVELRRPPDQPADEREAVRVQPRRRQPETTSPPATREPSTRSARANHARRTCRRSRAPPRGRRPASRRSRRRGARSRPRGRPPRRPRPAPRPASRSSRCAAT